MDACWSIWPVNISWIQEVMDGQGRNSTSMSLCKSFQIYLDIHTNYTTSRATQAPHFITMIHAARKGHAGSWCCSSLGFCLRWSEATLLSYQSHRPIYQQPQHNSKSVRNRNLYFRYRKPNKGLLLMDYPQIRLTKIWLGALEIHLGWQSESMHRNILWKETGFVASIPWQYVFFHQLFCWMWLFIMWNIQDY